MKLFTRLPGLVSIIMIVSLVACQRRPQALFMPEGHVAATRSVPVPATAPLPAVGSESNAPSPVAVTPEAGALLATTASDIAHYRQPLTRPHHTLSEPTTPQRMAKRAAKTVDRATRNQLKRQWRERMSPSEKTFSGLAIASLVCGILAFFILGIVLGILAIIFGGVALSKIRKNPETGGRGTAVAGLVLGIIATIVTIIYLASR